MSVVDLRQADAEASEAMKAMANRLRQLADVVERGGVRAIAVCHVESGPECWVTRDWVADHGRFTLAGGLHCLLQAVSSDAAAV